MTAEFMSPEDRFYSIGVVQDYFITRMDELVENDRFDDSHSIFEEFVVDMQEPDEWIFLNDLTVFI